MVKSQVIYKDYSKDAERTALVSGENLAHMFGKIARWYTDISWVGHTHTEANITDFGTYAGSSTKGGAATSANKLNIGASDIGSETKPVYFNATTGKPVACAYSLNASVPANAVFTDINVKQSPSTANESREVLFAGNTGNTETTGTVGKSNKLYFNPNTGALTATSFSGSVDASNLTGSIDAGRLPTTSVTAGSYGPAAGGTLAHGGTFDVGYVTVDKYGRLTGASTKTFTLPAQYVHPTYTSKTSGLYKITVDGTGHVSGTAAVTASDLPAHTHDYLPLTGGTVTGGITYKGTTYDISAADNGVTTTSWPSTFNLIDKSDRIFTRIEGILYTNGDVGCQLYVRNYNTSGTQVAQKGLQFVMNKSGSLTWSVSDPANFRSAISAAAVDHTHPYLPESTVTGSPDLDTYLTSGVYHIKTQTSEHAPTTNHATLFVDGTVGTPYQLFIPDVSNGVWYSRYKSGTSAWSSWLSLKMTDTVYTHPTYTSKTSGLYKITVDGTGHVSGTAAVAAADLPSHTHAYLPLSGGTMAGAITFQVADAIKYNAASATYTMISFITGDTSGHGISIGGGGLTVLGSGESASALISALSLAASNETTYIASDNNIEFYSNCQTIGNRLGIVFDTSGRLRPNTNNTRTLGGSDYYWNKAYIKLIYGGGNGSWISGRDNAVVINNTVPAGDSYAPVIAVKTNLGSWTVGSLGSSSKTTEHLYFSYTTDANYNAGTNASSNYYLSSSGWFSGTAAKADKWSTARTLTIGSTGKSVDGSGNVSWSLSEIGAAASSHSHSNYLPQTMVSTTPDLNTYDTTGIYHISVSSTNAPVTQHSTLYVEANVGTHYQIFKPDNLDTTWYTRHKVTDGWSDWVALKLTDTVYTHPTYASKTSGLYKITVDGTGHISATAAVAASDLPAHTHSYLPLSGGTMTGAITLVGSKYGVSETALNCNNSNITGVNRIIFADLADSSQEGLSFYRSSNVYDNFWIKNGVMYFTPNRTNEEGNDPTTYTVYHSGNCTYSTVGAAAASHTHSYLPLSGGTLTGNLTMGSSTQTTLPNCGVTVHDIRSVNVPASGFNSNGRLVNFYFHMADSPNTSQWWSIMHVKGWTSDYNAWELAGTAHNDDARTRPLYVRTSQAGTAWGSWRKIYDSSNKPTPSEIGAAASSHSHSEYLPLTGGTMTGDILFTGVTSTSYPAVSKTIQFSGSTDAASIFFEVTASDKGCLVLQTTDDADAKIVFRNKVTSGGTRANEVTITDGVIAGNGSGLTSLNASNISSGTLAEARLPKAYIPLAGSTAITGSLRATMGSTAGPFMSVSNGTYEIGLHVGTGGTNHGIFDFSSSVNAWMCYHDGTKNIFNGQANTAVTATKSTYTDHSPSITIQTGSSAQAKISLQTLINWLINTKKVLPTGVFIHKIIQSGWSYAANDILQLTCSGTNYEVQLAGVALEFIGTVSSYNAGEFRMMIHTSPTISFTVTSGYKAGPTSSTFVYTCNGSGYAPTWRLISNGLKYANGYWGLTDPSGGDADWTRTTSLGIIPYQSGGAGSGHQSLGTSSWYFLSAYIDTVYGSLSGNASSASMPYGFESRSSGAGWAAGGTFVTAWNAGNGCEIAFMKNYPASGQLSCCIDGYFFQNEGKKRVLDESNFSSYITPSSIGAAASSHSHTYIESKANYTFTSSTLPNSFDWGVSAGFVNSDSGFGSFGSVLTVRTYSGGGGTLQLYAPYSSTYGGTHLKARFGNYASSSGNSWTSLRELAWNDEKLGITTVTGSPDLDTYLTTGIYTINTSSAVHSPTTNYSTLFVDGSVGTPFQILKPDANDTTWYTRHRNNSAGTWYNWVALTLNGIPNTADGLSAAINLLSTGSSYPTDNDYYVTQYAGGGTSTVSYHRRPHSALWEYIRQKISNSGGFLGHTQIFSGSTAITAGKEKTIVTVTTDSGSQDARTYFVIRISWSSPSSDVTFIIPKKYNTWVNGVFAVNPGGGAPGTYNACVGIGVYFNRDSTGNTFKISFNTNTAFTLLRVDEYYC